VARSGGGAGAGGQARFWRAAVARAVGVALGLVGGRAGPVHVNVPFAEPLVPDTDGWPEPLDGRPGGAPWTDFGVGRAGEPATSTLPLDPSAPTLVLAGAMPPGRGSVLPADLGAPVVAEPHSPLWPRALRSGPWLLGSPGLDRFRPAQVLLYGRPTLHRSLARLIADPGVAVYAVAGTVGATGPNGGELPASVRAVGVPPPLRPPADWCERWARADAAACAALDRALAAPAAPTGLRLAAALVTALPDGALLLLGSSNPVRDVSLAARPRTGLTVLANRGVAGIDFADPGGPQRPRRRGVLAARTGRAGARG
jgi:2-succinyl-5-enolpyruvyl-6-hydroxy-3-cyclohexene-1-carboxylate synthase